MSYTIFSKANAFPAAIAGSKLVKTFPSGLLLVSQDYAVPRGQEDFYASRFAAGQPLDVESPAIDGLYIFPAPEWRDSGDGFTRLTVSAYGRWNVEGQKTFSKNLGGFVVQYSVLNDYTPSIPQGVARSVPTINDNLVWQFVIPKAASPNVTVADELKVYRLTGENANPVLVGEFFDRTGYNTANPSVIAPPSSQLSVSKNLIRAENTNFGAWDEWTVVWAATPISLVILGSFFKILPPIGGSILHDLNIGTVSFSTNLKGHQNSTYNNGNAFFVNVDKVESLHITEFSFSSSTSRTNIPVNTNATSFRGGNVRWQTDGTFEYTGPAVTKPSGLPSVGQIYTSNGFTWEAKFEEGEPNDFVWAFKTSYEIFTFTFKNELNQTGEGYIAIRFVDSQYPASE